MNKPKCIWKKQLDGGGTPQYLSYPNSLPQTGLDLAEMHDSRHSDHLQHAVPVIRCRELVFLVRTPWIGARAPTTKRTIHSITETVPFVILPSVCAACSPQYVQNYNSLHRRQIHHFSVHLQSQFLVQFLDRLTTHHLAQSHLHVHTLVVQPRIELVRILLARIMEVQAQIGVDADAKVIVHHQHLRVVLALGGASDCIRQRECFVAVMDIGCIRFVYVDYKRGEGKTNVLIGCFEWSALFV